MSSRMTSISHTVDSPFQIRPVLLHPWSRVSFDCFLFYCTAFSGGCFLRTSQTSNNPHPRMFHQLTCASFFNLRSWIILATPLTMFASVGVLSFVLPIFGMAQTITHISQVPAITDLPCLSQKLVQAFTELRHANCPQPSPLSYASCLCLQSTNALSISSSMSFWGSIYCNDRSSIDSSMAMGVFSSYCDLASKDTAGSTTASSSTSVTSSTSAPNCECYSSCLNIFYSNYVQISATQLRQQLLSRKQPSLLRQSSHPAPTSVTIPRLAIHQATME